VCRNWYSVYRSTQVAWYYFEWITIEFSHNVFKCWGIVEYIDKWVLTVWTKSGVKSVPANQKFDAIYLDVEFIVYKLHCGIVSNHFGEISPHCFVYRVRSVKIPFTGLFPNRVDKRLCLYELIYVFTKCCKHSESNGFIHSICIRDSMSYIYKLYIHRKCRRRNFLGRRRILGISIWVRFKCFWRVWRSG